MVVSNHSTVIVALPAEDDPVRKFSSEKEPHLTLLYLGDYPYTSDEMVHITEYVQHAASLLSRFGLEVVNRGVLGPKDADVLFFNKKWSKHVATFRSQLLADPVISKGFLSTDQFPDWTPHLTMGYPETPATKDTREFPGFSFVNFDRIALWTGDYTGPTFQLPTYDRDLEVAMSQLERGRSAMGDVLQHHGVKGMKWGVRRGETGASTAPSSPGPRPKLSEDVKNVSRIHTKIRNGGTGSLSNQEMRQFLERMDLERRYSQMTAVPQAKSRLDLGHDQVKRYLAMGQTYENVRKFLETDTGKMVKTGVSTAVTAGLAYATGGTSAAATAGAGAIIRRVASQ
jgi:2'-5' RNA ligase